MPARCVWVDTGLGDAQINAITRLLEAHGRLPMPEELRERGKVDARYFGPDAQFRYERSVEPPVSEEGFSAIEVRRFTRDAPSATTARAVVLEFDRVLTSNSGDAIRPALRPQDIVIGEERRAVLLRYAAEGWLLFAQAWRPQVSAGETSLNDVQACFDRTRELLDCDIQLGCCPHRLLVPKADSGLDPPACRRERRRHRPIDHGRPRGRGPNDGGAPRHDLSGRSRVLRRAIAPVRPAGSRWGRWS
jgi:hypothetical protein